jgi:hypothetical protein
MQRPLVGIGFGILAIVVALCFVPFKRMTAPHWYIGVTNADGSPASNIPVREEANDYTCGAAEQEENATTDSGGKIEFAPKHIRTTVAHCISQSIKSAQAGVHSSFGRNTWAFPIGADGYILDKNGNIYSWSGNPGVLHSRLVLGH